LINLQPLSASQFVKTDASKNLISSTIGSTDLPADVAYTDVNQMMTAVKTFTSSVTLNNALLVTSTATLGADFSPVMIDFAKAFEVQTNIILAQALSKATRNARLVNVGGKTVDASTDGPFMIAEFYKREAVETFDDLENPLGSANNGKSRPRKK